MNVQFVQLYLTVIDLEWMVGCVSGLRTSYYNVVFEGFFSFFYRFAFVLLLAEDVICGCWRDSSFLLLFAFILLLICFTLLYLTSRLPFYETTPDMYHHIKIKRRNYNARTSTT